MDVGEELKIGPGQEEGGRKLLEKIDLDFVARVVTLHAKIEKMSGKVVKEAQEVSRQGCRRVARKSAGVVYASKRRGHTRTSQHTAKHEEQASTSKKKEEKQKKHNKQTYEVQCTEWTRNGCRRVARKEGRGGLRGKDEGHTRTSQHTAKHEEQASASKKRSKRSTTSKRTRCNALSGREKGAGGSREKAQGWYARTRTHAHKPAHSKARRASEHKQEEKQKKHNKQTYEVQCTEWTRNG